jgi:hypothetical protein
MHDLMPTLLASLTLPGLMLLGIVVWLVLSLHRVALRFSPLGPAGPADPVPPALLTPIPPAG